MKPSVGRIVHYVSYGAPGGEYGKECRAAIVTQVCGHSVDPATMHETDGWVVGLCVLNPTGQFFNPSIVQMENGRDGGTWHWPEREPQGESPKFHVAADLSPEQIKRITEMIQAAILRQVKRGQRTGLA